MKRFSRSNAPIDPIPVVVRILSVFQEQAFGDRRFGAPISDDSQRAVFEEGYKRLNETLVQRLSLGQKVSVAVLLCFTMKPDYLGSIEHGKFSKIAWPPVRFG